ncbi:hypothetical protein E2C01_022582 [Portunus trituberculatus]|uniref:Uncharacterized protein n=1 Tax=Portunus trituberculatus TaxID=210409 RepID=A0A5B7E5S1_PORTR|nr:hypothetical protein [Portunus trituberculatus]
MESFECTQEMTLQDMYVDDKHYEEHLRMTRVLVPSQCRCETPRHVDLDSEARISISEQQMLLPSSNLVSKTLEHERIEMVTREPTTVEVTEFAKRKEMQGLAQEQRQTTQINQKDDGNLSRNIQLSSHKSLPVFLRMKRSTPYSDILPVPLVINFYLNQIWPNASCTISPSLYSHMNDIMAELPHAFWQAGGTAEEVDLALLAGAIFAGMSECWTQNVTCAMQTGHLASLMVASWRAAAILKDHILSASKVSVYHSVPIT